jgi:thiamine-monophosphate kinase
VQNPRILSKSEEAFRFVRARLNRPLPRIQAGLALRGIASAAIDLSDGLLADLTHILTASEVGACIELSLLPLSESLQQIPMTEACKLALTAGDDYELCFTVPPAKKDKLEQSELGCPYTRIGTVEQKTGLRCLRKDLPVPCADSYIGYRHF